MAAASAMTSCIKPGERIRLPAVPRQVGWEDAEVVADLKEASAKDAIVYWTVTAECGVVLEAAFRSAGDPHNRFHVDAAGRLKDVRVVDHHYLSMSAHKPGSSVEYMLPFNRFRWVLLLLPQRCS